MIQPKQGFIFQMKKLLGNETEVFFDYIKKPPQKIIRVNTIKNSREDLIKRLSQKKWKPKETPYENALIIESQLLPGELGKAVEHQIGFYYVQDLSSMMPPLALNPEKDEAILDLCAAPGSKTTQIVMLMKNKGTIIANDIALGRIKALQTNLERCGCTNVIITRMKGETLCNRFKKNKIFFDKILVDAPCSGEGTIRFDLKILKMWNPNMIKKLANEQKRLCVAALSCLKPQGILVYSTCTYEPEENEMVVDFLLKNFNLKIEEINLPIKTRPGITKWQGNKLNDELKKTLRIYPQDNNSEGFFVAKLRKIK
jgi:NOL1/NOP2/sun family putative RNA methylase